MAISWTKEKINELTTQEVVALQENARVRGNSEIVNWCEEILATKKPIRTARTSSTTKNLEAECSHKLSEFAKYLSAKYDLSPATASKKSEGVKGFRPHNLTSKTGQAKLGGDQRTGKVAMDRYISYRTRDDVLSLTAWLVSKDDIENLKWQVRGPSHYFIEANMTSEAGSNGNKYKTTLEEFIEFDSACQKFEDVLEKLLAT